VILGRFWASFDPNSASFFVSDTGYDSLISTIVVALNVFLPNVMSNCTGRSRDEEDQVRKRHFHSSLLNENRSIDSLLWLFVDEDVLVQVGIFDKETSQQPSGVNQVRSTSHFSDAIATNKD